MLSPKRTKFRRHHRGRMRGKATRGNTLAFGDYGLQTTERSWITSRQIEAARRAMTRYVKRGGKFGFVYFPINQLQCEQQKLEWVQVKVHPNTGLLL